MTQPAADPVSGPKADARADPLADAMRSWSALLASAWPGSGLGNATGGAAPAPTALEALLMQAQWLGSAALLRSGQRAAQSWLQYTQAAPADAALDVRVDAARAHLRRLAEIAADEARGVGQQLLALDEQACGLIDPSRRAPAPAAGSGEPAPVRRAHAKP
jgi:hypothetical protein